MKLYLVIATYNERSQKWVGGGRLGNGCSDVVLKNRLLLKKPCLAGFQALAAHWRLDTHY